MGIDGRSTCRLLRLTPELETVGQRGVLRMQRGKPFREGHRALRGGTSTEDYCQLTRIAFEKFEPLPQPEDTKLRYHH